MEVNKYIPESFSAQDMLAVAVQSREKIVREIISAMNEAMRNNSGGRAIEYHAELLERVNDILENPPAPDAAVNE